MKRLAAILSLFLALCTASAWAEGIDLDAMSIDELVVLQGRIADEIADRLKKPSESAPDVMYTGEYECGIDIKPGIYLVTGLEGERDFGADLYESKNAYDKSRYSGYTHIYVRAGDTYYLELEEGMFLTVNQGSALITPWVKPSWVP